ncbi:hypothetical protein FKW77_010883 [Venturia effusa]|uniref:DUF6594 domain-containing protein n=1 Tax=Venturia effusa TaxID=50376 RepID=A0A517KYQ4_9PEZI|nr:hypothetical protein FKW77_010883 [Venturia effusa]
MAQVPDAVGGYPKLATHMGMFPQMAVFKRFGDISARNLLYLQAELLLLQKRLLEVETIDAKVNGRFYAKNFADLLAVREAKEDRQQWDLILELQEALLRAHAVADMETPGASDLKAIHKYLSSPALGAQLLGIDRNVWGRLDDPHNRATDLVALQIREIGDPFSRMVMKLVHPFYNYIGKHYRKADPVLGVPVFKDEIQSWKDFILPQLHMADLLSTDRALYGLCGGLVVVSGYALWARYQSDISVTKDDFERILEILHGDQSLVRRIQAKIDTAADYSLISKSIAEQLDLSILPLTQDDPDSLMLADDRTFPLAGKVLVRFHGINPEGLHLAFRFGKYENVATFYVPADTDISGFDAYIGLDSIHKLQLHKRNFFASRGGSTQVGGYGQYSALENAMNRYDEHAQNYLDNGGTAPTVPTIVFNGLPAHLQPGPGQRLSAAAHTWAAVQRTVAARAKKSKRWWKKEKKQKDGNDKDDSSSSSGKKDGDGGNGTAGGAVAVVKQVP